MDAPTKLHAAWHIEVIGVPGNSETVTTSARRFLHGRDQAGLATLLGIDHDLGRPIVATGAVAGFTLHTRQSRWTGGVTRQTGRRRVLDSQALGGTAMNGLLPASVNGTVTELATIGSDEGSFARAQAEETNKREDPTDARMSGSHAFRSIRLARANRLRQDIVATRPETYA